MKNRYIVYIFVVSLTLWSCAKKAEEAPIPGESSNFDAIVTSSAATDNPKDSTHKFVRTAELTFKVKSVIESTYDIEAITSNMGGFVTYTNLSNEKISTDQTDISLDSSVTTTRFIVRNTMTLRVPNTKLDTTLKLISRNIVYLDSRVIKADDVALQLLSNDLTIQRSKRNEARLRSAIDNKGKKLAETSSSEELIFNKQEQTDNARLANMSLNDQINFSTIQLDIYQNASVLYEKTVREDSTGESEPTLGFRILNSLSMGWTIIKEILLFLFNLWGFVVLGFIGYGIYRLYERKRKKE